MRSNKSALACLTTRTFRNTRNLDSWWSGNCFDLAAARFIAPIGLEHFFDAFALNQKRLLKVDAAAALQLPGCSEAS